MIKVVKFGGSSLADAVQIKKAGKIADVLLSLQHRARDLTATPR